MELEDYKDNYNKGYIEDENPTNEPTLEEAIKVLQKHFREDKSEDSIYTSFKDNIAMSFKDQFCKVQDIPADDQVATCLTFRDVHVISNLAAKNFLDNLIKE